MTEPVREDVDFPSGDGRCAAWLVRPPAPAGDVPVVVMAHGFSLTRHDGLPRFAERLAADAGVAVLLYDPRHLGDSPGEPRQRFRVGLQQEDLVNAVAHARSLPGLDPDRVVLWCYSFGAVPALRLAARDGRIAGVLALCPFADGLARALATPPAVSAWVLPRALADALGRPTTIPVTAPAGGRAAMPLPGEAEGFARAVAPGSPWRNRISPAIFLTVATLRPVRLARRLTMPVWVGLCERDDTVSRRAVERLARDAPDAVLERYPYDHFEPVAEAAERVAGDQVSFLRARGLAGRAAAGA